MAFRAVSPNIDFPKEEERVLKFWQENRIFEKSVAGCSAEKAFTFYDGPPFATGVPHYGHLLAGTIKDIVPRYWTMKGQRVERRFGWDCHGLPIEYEIDKKLGISGRAGVEKFGIANYNRECRSIVLRYTAEWEKTTMRLGRWIDFRNDYKTMDVGFMESVWWVFKQLWDKGLVYEGFRVMPYSTAVATPLSNFEAGSNYKEVQDPAITVTFTLKSEPNVHLLAWTTTPWTLPSNLALAVNPEIDYVRIRDKKDKRQFILARARLAHYYRDEHEYEILQTLKGRELVGWAYEPLFPYFADRAALGAFKIVLGEHVTAEDGTGIVHTAPGFGEDDFFICQKYGIELVVPVDDDGCFTAAVVDWQGRHVKEADKDIIASLKAQGKIVRHESITHSYPFCWRSDTPLIYRALSSWFVSVEKLKNAMLAANQETHWVPEYLRDGRFGNWLADARDWNISRNRYWGNPLPIWKNNETGEYLCVGSVAELERLTGVKVTDLHREFIDHLEIKDKKGRGIFKRVPEVLDCWFESGAMPYAQNHYPFANKEVFERGFPADFIAEGLDQTRGWFYTLTVLGVALFGKSPFKNVVVNGMVLAEDGKKMSKRLQNYPDPSFILDTYGADALRLYMIQSPAVRAEELRFSEAGVKDIVRRILLKWWNAYTFFVSYAVIDDFSPVPNDKTLRENILDAWILSRLQTLLKRTETEMAVYHLYNVVPALLNFIEDLTNVYIRLNRKRFWAEGDSVDKLQAYQTLYSVLATMVKAMAPFTPFLAETMYTNLKGQEGNESVHLESYPVAKKDLIRTDLEEAVSLMQRVILMGRSVREEKNIKVKIPLKRLTIIHRDEKILAELKPLENYLCEELNVREVTYSQKEDDFVTLAAKANGAVLGKRLGNKFSLLMKAVAQCHHDTIVRWERGETVEIAGEKIGKDDVLIARHAKKGHEGLMSDAFITVELDLNLDENQILEGLSREVVNRVQKMRKNAGLNLSDRIRVEYVTAEKISQAIAANLVYIKEQTLSLDFKGAKAPKGEHAETCEIDGESLSLALTKV